MFGWFRLKSDSSLNAKKFWHHLNTCHNIIKQEKYDANLLFWIKIKLQLFLFWKGKESNICKQKMSFILESFGFIFMWFSILISPLGLQILEFFVD